MTLKYVLKIDVGYNYIDTIMYTAAEILHIYKQLFIQ